MSTLTGTSKIIQPKAPRKLLLPQVRDPKTLCPGSGQRQCFVGPRFLLEKWEGESFFGVGKGKAQFDKREDLKLKEADREVKRATYASI